MPNITVIAVTALYVTTSRRIVFGLVGYLGRKLRGYRQLINQGIDPSEARKLAMEIKWSKVKKPKIKNPKLQNIINGLYQTNPSIGNGSTADVIRYELKIGKTANGSHHTEEIDNSIKKLNEFLQQEKGLRSSDIKSAKAVLNDIKNAMNTN